MRRTFLTILHIFLCQVFSAQKFTNGSFENNSANGTDQINLSNADLNAKLPGVTAFGTYGDVDIIKSAAYGGGGAQHKDWYLAITGGGTDIIALSLSQSLIKGKKYSLSFYDRRHFAHAAYPIQIGLSNSNSSFGSVIYTSPEAPVLNVWTKRTFSFVAAEDARFITVQMQSGGISDWANIDNFVFGDSKCNEALTIEASASVINKGEAIVLTASGGNTYTWSANSIGNYLTGNVLRDNPAVNTIYMVSGNVPDCGISSATISIAVNEVVKDSLMAEKRDTAKIINSVIAKPKFVKFNRRKLNGRKYKIQETVHVNNATVKIVVWDKNRVDGDVVSIYLNGQTLEENLTVSKTKKEITLQLHPGKNVLVMYAINLGFIPPNTAAIGINNDKRKLLTLVSDLKKSGALELIYNPDGFVLK